MVRSVLVPVFVVLIYISGCMVGPEYKRPSTAADTDDKFVNALDISSIKCKPAQTTSRWWDNFADEPTAKLVNTAIKNNQDNKAAAARYMQAKALYKSASGATLPQFDYSFNRQRNKTALDLPNGLTNFTTTTYTQQVSVAYVFDIFGKLKKTQRAAWDELLSSDFAKDALVRAVIADVVIARTNIGNIKRQLDISKFNTKGWQRTHQIIERRYRQGLVSPLDVRLARENLEASLANETEYEELLKEEQLRLDVLLGLRPGTSSELPELNRPLPRLEDSPSSLPAKLLDRRPDLRSLEFQLAAATESVGVNVARLYPDLTLTASTGFRSSNFDDLIKKDFEIYSLILDSLQPIYRGGQLKADIEYSEARVEELAAQYAGKVLEAIREVESALVREKILRERLQALDRRLKEAKASEKLARDRYLRGLEKLVTVLETERRKRVAELDISITNAAIWRTRVELYLALGGDWGDYPS